MRWRRLAVTMILLGCSAGAAGVGTLVGGVGRVIGGILAIAFAVAAGRQSL